MKRSDRPPDPAQVLRAPLRIFVAGSKTRNGRAQTKRVRRLARRFAKKLRFQKGILSVACVTPERMANMHRKFSGAGGATDVLAFLYMRRGTGVVADVVVCSVVIRKKMAGYGIHGKNFDTALAFVLAHAMLHLKGFEHRTQKEDRRMGKKVDQLLSDV